MSILTIAALWAVVSLMFAMLAVAAGRLARRADAHEDAARPRTVTTSD
jgi:hypothetical protein